jgi:PAS domain S-box-containing protein
MLDNYFTKGKITLFAVLGLTAGIQVFYALESGEVRYLVSVAGLVVIAGLIAVIVRQRRMTGPAESGKDGSNVGFVVDTFQDLVGKLKEKERELERLKSSAEEKAVSIEAYNENVLQSIPSGVVSIDNLMKIKSINQAAERILGVRSDEIIGKDFDGVFSEPLIQLIADEKPVSRGEYQYITHDKRHVWLGISTSQLKNPAGEKIGIIFVFSDLTDIKALQEQVELRQRLSQLGEMSAGISHELRNSMSVISGYARLLEKKADPALKPAVDAITAEIKLMDGIISELLAFAKPTVLNKEEVDLIGMVKETAESAVAGSGGIRLSGNFERSVTVPADKVLLRQALSNIFVNAVEAMDGTGSLDTEVNDLNDRVEIRIRDTGPGIPQEIREKIFLPFFTTKDKGTGLGLALVQKIIISHGGNIGFDSKEGAGTTFIIALSVKE